jgi:hypothetical protein
VPLLVCAQVIQYLKEPIEIGAGYNPNGSLNESLVKSYR